jgi:hypothetical protein
MPNKKKPQYYVQGYVPPPITPEAEIEQGEDQAQTISDAILKLAQICMDNAQSEDDPQPGTYQNTTHYALLKLAEQISNVSSHTTADAIHLAIMSLVRNSNDAR